MVYEVGSRYPKRGDRVRVAQKKDYQSGVLTEGLVREVLTKKEFHPRGHKVRLESGAIGRVQEFVGGEEDLPPRPDPDLPGEEELR